LKRLAHGALFLCAALITACSGQGPSASLPTASNGTVSNATVPDANHRPTTAPAATPSGAKPVPTSSPGLTPTIVWQTGGGKLGQYVLPATTDGQCAGVGPTISGQNASFTVLRNTSRTYSYNGNTFNGASSCYRNQMNPVDPNTGTNFLLAMGKPYTFTFQTVVKFNGNDLYEGAKDGGLAVDIPAIVWQTHSDGGDGQPCDTLVIQNTYVAYANGITKYGAVPQGGLPTWNFHSCAESDFTGAAYNSPDTLHDGEVDSWLISMTPALQGQSGGSIIVNRNGTQVYNSAAPACDSSTTQCFWNFGPYVFYWENTEEPSGWNNAGVTVDVNGMTLTSN
jgi:hypothetical protein